MRAARSRRGFTLLEAMVALVVGAATVVMAAKLATVAIQQNGQGRQKNDLSVRTRVLGEQLRADVRLAGMGSTGAIGVDPTTPVLGLIALAATPAGGFAAIPAVAGANNIPTQALPSGTVEGGSDALQLVVPNPATSILTTERARRGSNVLTFVDTALVPATCDLVYIHDHTNPNSGGRTQVAWTSGIGATQITVLGQLMFTVAPGSEVMCARISTYWVDEDDWLHRTDLGRNNAIQLAGSPVWVNDAPLEPDLMAPGIQDFQVAYRVSAEAFRLATIPQPVPTDPDASWVWRGRAPNADALLTAANPHLWFEVRLVRMNLFARRQKRGAGAADLVNLPGIEDGDQVPAIRGAFGEWVTFSEAVTNLRIFDSAAAAEVPAEPY